MIKKLKNGNYIEMWVNTYTGDYVTQVKDKDGNEIECEYDGDKEGAAYSIKHFIDKYGLALNEEAEIDKLAKKKAKETLKKTKGSKLNPLATFFIPDKEAGISKFNQHMGISDLSSTTGSTNCGVSAESKIVARANAESAGEGSGDAGGGEASGGMGESLEESMLPRQELINRIKKLGFNYKFDKYADAQLYRIYQERAAYVERKKAEDKAQKEMAKDHEEFYKNYKDDNDVTFDGDSFWFNGMEFESEEAAREYNEEE